MKILVCFGTRPEAVKMAPVCLELKRQKMDFKICITAQHREMLDQVMSFFELKADFDLDLMSENQTLNNLASGIYSKMDKVFDDYAPNLVLVQGDTTTAATVAMAAFHRQIKVGHVEAGLRTYNRNAPFPEEVNRQVISRIADFHFSPTRAAKNNLINENIPPSSILTTGNTVVDALELAISKISDAKFIEIDELRSKLDSSKKMILVTGHRRENFGEGMQNVCDALIELSNRNDVQIIYPVHLNPNVKDQVYKNLADQNNILLIPPLSYPAFLWLMTKANFIISDSGGIQEEAPQFKKPVIVTRESTERPEGVNAGFSHLVGTNSELIVQKCLELLKNPPKFSLKANPFGDGFASGRIVSFIVDKLKNK